MIDALNLIMLNLDKLPEYIIVEPWRVALICICWVFFGASLWSGITCFHFRIENEKSWRSWVRTRSYCNSCKKTLEWWKVIPILGAILCKGKCDKCGYKIGYVDSICELLFGLMFLTVVWFC